jgi:O-antigen ligase
MENAARPVAGFRSSVTAAAVRRTLPRVPQLPFYIILAGVTCVFIAAAVSGTPNLTMPVKAMLAFLVVIAAAAAVFWKPAIFPLGVYFLAVPFDNVLQTGSGTITKMLAGASIVVVLLAMAADRRRTVTPPLASVAGWGALLLWAVISLTWALEMRDANSWVTIVSQLFALYALFSMFRVRESEVRVLSASIIAGGVLCAIYGLWLYHTGTLVSSSGVAQLRLNIQYGTNGTAGSINSDHFAGALVLPIALALGMSLRLRGIARVLGWAALVMLFLGVFVAATRSAVIAIGIMWLYLIIFSRHGRKELIAMGVAGFLASLALPSVWLRFADPTQGAGNGRYAIWSIGWQAFQTHWLAGWGAGDFRDAYAAAFLKAYQSGQMPPRIQDAHNMLISTSVELGIIGIVLLLAAWFFQFRTVSVIPRSSPLFDLRLAAEAGTLGLFFIALTLDVLYFKYLWIGFMIAVLIRNAYVCEKQAEFKSEITPGITPGNARVVPQA